MIVIPVPSFPRVNPDFSRVMQIFEWDGQRQYINAAFDVGVPFREFLNDCQQAGADETEDELRALAELILERSNYYCPKDTGELVESGYIEEQGSGMSYAAQVAYATRYALYVHEDLTVHHDDPTCAKFLDRASEEVIAEFGATGFSMISQDVDNIFQVNAFTPLGVNNLTAGTQVGGAGATGSGTSSRSGQSNPTVSSGSRSRCGRLRRARRKARRSR
jgi:hypothetical protein